MAFCGKDRHAALACILSVLIVPNNRFYCMFSVTCNMTLQVLLQTSSAFFFYLLYCTQPLSSLLIASVCIKRLLEYFVPPSQHT